LFEHQLGLDIFEKTLQLKTISRSCLGTRVDSDLLSIIIKIM